MNTNFWLAVSTIGPVTFLAIGVFEIDLVRGGGLPPAESSKRTAVMVQLVALNVAFGGTLLPTGTAILSLAWRQDLLPPKLNAGVLVLAILAFGIALTAHWYDLKRSIEERGRTAAVRPPGPSH